MELEQFVIYTNNRGICNSLPSIIATNRESAEEHWRSLLSGEVMIDSSIKLENYNYKNVLEL